ncbi:glycosyltransferase family 4 protein [Deinococcus sp. RM]|uniref:glycosyltransferase family 4 protein n=1 Tax=Deinococcus sp. RM TaxID=2316359 RepID=UPI000E692499|nr:glycosyltransferase family 4 protein [Deinococcus sp. RM]RIY01665.1 glycosyltransferase WbuB [Deinococcus sp. RM]
MPSLGKILIIVENLPVPFDRRVWMEATTLKSHGYEVTVICPTGRGYEKTYELIEGINIYRHPLPDEVSSAGGYIREYIVALSWEFRLAFKAMRDRGRFDLVHICNPPDLLFLVAATLKLLKGSRVIFDQHDLNPEMYETKFGRRDFFYYGLRLAERLTYATADAVISTNESYRSIATGRGGKHPDEVFVVRSGPDLDRFQATSSNDVYRRGRRYLVGYVGVMGEQEGIDHLLRSISHIVSELNRSDIQFMLIGGGPAVEEMRALSRRLGIEDYVEFTGRIPDADLLERLSSCDICVNPDPMTPFNNLSTMNKVLEYMALSKPIVQYDVLEGRRSALDASFYAKDEYDFAIKIIDLLEDEEQRLRMGAYGRQRMVEELEWKHQAAKLLQAYSKAMLGKNGNASP